MSEKFDSALSASPAPRTVGDVTLRYEPSMLIGETARRKPGWRSLLAWLFGISSLLLGLGGLLLHWAVWPIGILLSGGGLGLALAVWVGRLETRRRRFIINFAEASLRLDFSSPIAGYPRSMRVPLTQVRCVTLERQGDGASCLCVDFVRGSQLLREVLVAYIADTDRLAAVRLKHVLGAAFGSHEQGLGPPTVDWETSVFD